MAIKKMISDHGCKIPETLLTPKSKRERLEGGEGDPFEGVPLGGEWGVRGGFFGGVGG